MPITYIAGAGARGGLLAPDDQPMPITYNTLTSFYESSCANNGKRALKTLSYIAGAGARGGLLVPAYQCGRLRRLRQRQAPAAGAPDQVHSCGEDAQAAHHLCRYAAEEEGLLPEGARAPGKKDSFLKELAHQVDTKGKDVDTKGNGVDTKDNDVDTKGNAVDTKGNDVDTKGNTVDTKGNTVDTKGNYVDTKGNAVDTKGNDVDTKGNAVDTKGLGGVQNPTNVPRAYRGGPLIVHYLTFVAGGKYLEMFDVFTDQYRAVNMQLTWPAGSQYGRAVETWAVPGRWRLGSAPYLYHFSIMTLFYGSSCANNGKDAHNTPERIGSVPYI
eukprot:1176798-Prorocentrum_minimum.AAC.2